MSGTFYLPAGPHISWEAFDDEFVILDLNSGRYFSCAGGAAVLWRAVIAGHDPAELAVAAELELAAQLSKCFAAMQAAELLRAEGQALPPSDAILAQLRAAGDDWRLEAFDDLAALLVADPIHDTDREAGWPHQPQ